MSALCSQHVSEQMAHECRPIQKLWFVCFFICAVLSSPPFSDKVIRHRACSLKDTAHAIFAAELDPEFDRMCEEIKEARRKRGKNFI